MRAALGRAASGLQSLGSGLPSIWTCCWSKSITSSNLLAAEKRNPLLINLSHLTICRLFLSRMSRTSFAPSAGMLRREKSMRKIDWHVKRRGFIFLFPSIQWLNLFWNFDWIHRANCTNQSLNERSLNQQHQQSWRSWRALASGDEANSAIFFSALLPLSKAVNKTRWNFQSAL